MPQNCWQYRYESMDRWLRSSSYGCLHDSLERRGRCAGSNLGIASPGQLEKPTAIYGRRRCAIFGASAIFQSMRVYRITSFRRSTVSLLAQTSNPPGTQSSVRGCISGAPADSLPSATQEASSSTRLLTNVRHPTRPSVLPFYFDLTVRAAKVARFAWPQCRVSINRAECQVMLREKGGLRGGFLKYTRVIEGHR